MYVLFVSCLFVVLVISHFSFEDRMLVLVVPVSGHCLHFTFTKFSVFFRNQIASRDNINCIIKDAGKC